MLKPGVFNLELYRGDSYALRFILWADDLKTDPLDLNGATVAAQIKDKVDGAIVVNLQCTPTLPNIVDVVITPAVYTSCPKKGVWDLQITHSSGAVHTAVAGKVSVTADVTNSVLSP